MRLSASDGDARRSAYRRRGSDREPRTRVDDFGPALRCDPRRARRSAAIFTVVSVHAARLLAVEVSSAISDRALIVYAASSIRTIRRPLGCRPSGYSRRISAARV